ncbi:crotonobetainyl-CoA:carnitine CoA-transferase CaiB-like acyl-CoA transferase [Mesorhizobium sp. J18]|uniref:CaiB/BaiF CoA transferase family protein n=1 Tax=Mesorhizobium sp. J18 TaxID=935263 RepID=UPI00119AC0E5|nr:CaiB/BaiF CoA-transferase family protein [Mesorhizobium sp. J18]TWG94806.1 crotonobetainyl-CoA:carnitine CoA-transferase CaiB-like acyl-CoA transferase [Mesorhizobium sp. J18]
MTTKSSEPKAPRLLEGMTVLSFCHYLQGPAAAQYLADLGADVIKVEPKKGAFERHWAGASTFVEDVSVFFLCANRNKRSIALDLKHPDSTQILHRLIASADVLVENYRPGVMDRLNLGYEAVRRIKPDIIYASATGFGADGPFKDRPGQDLLIQARSGLIAASGARPTVTGCAAVDQHGAALLAMGIAAAYASKLTTGKGTRIEGSLFNAGIDLQAESLTLYYSGKQSRERFTRDPHLGTWFHEAPYGVYELTDAFVAISLNPVQKIADALGSEELAALAGNDAYNDRDLIASTLANILSEWSFADLERAFEPAGIWYERVNDYDDLLVDPQAVHNQIFRKIPVRGDEATIVNHPLKYDGLVPELRLMPPEIGQHGEEILETLGFSQEEIARLVESGALAQPPKTAEYKDGTTQ